MKEVLGDDVEKVIVSRRIVDSPCVVTTSEYGWFANMERIMKARVLRDNSMTSHMVSKRTMEVDPTHSIVGRPPVSRLQLGRANTVCGTHSPHDRARTEHRR